MIAIVTADRLFGVLLKSVLEEAAYRVVLCESLPDACTQCIWDLSLGPIPDGVVGISFSQDLLADADLLRPFPVRKLLALCRVTFAEEGSIMREALDGKSEETAPQDEVAYELLKDGVRCFGETVPLTPTERVLFACLLRHRPQTVTTSELYALLGEDRSNTLAVYMNSLRKKLDYRFSKRLIVTERAKGYRLL